MLDYKYLRYGDATICVNFCFESAFNESAWKMAHALSDNVLEQGYEWVVSVIPTMNSTLIHFDILKVSFEEVKNILEDEIQNTTGQLSKAKTFNIPVVYGGDFGPDLHSIASKMGCTEQEVIDKHVNSLSNVLCFTNPAGQPLMGGSNLPDNLYRLDEPRTRIPVGSIGIVGDQSTVYCLEAPGGWQIIGRTPVKMIYTNEMPPTFLRVGDKVAFFRIYEDEWNTYAGKELNELLSDSGETS